MTDTSVIEKDAPPVEVPPAARQPAAVTTIWFVVMAVALVAACAASVAFGSRVVSLSEVFEALTSEPEGIAELAVRERLPRTALAVIVGGTLAVAGAVFQGVTRNPLADPGLLGISSGASLAVVIGFTFFGLQSPTTTIWVAIAGAAGAATFVWLIGSMGRGGATPLKLALAGAATWAALSSLISAILLPRIEILDRFRFWQIGGVGRGEWDRIVIVIPFFVVGLLLCFAMARGLNALALGDDTAAGLGEHVTRTRLLAALGAVVLSGAATASAGPIAFVGLVVPHLSRLVIGVDHRKLLPFSALAGATLLVTSDVVGRVIARPTEVDVGIVTAFIGAPIFIWVIRRQKMREL
ncbi:MAG: iron ABC transporter permease [Actinomycetota bacterium]